MRLLLLSVAGRVPAWVEAGWEDYARRLGGRVKLELLALRPVPRGPGTVLPAALAEEGRRLERAIPRGAHVVALDERGTQWSTRELAARLGVWEAAHAEVALLVGGADGLAPALREAAAERWSLSRLTLPHALVRVLVAEQIYRAWSLAQGHPYHRD